MTRSSVDLLLPADATTEGARLLRELLQRQTIAAVAKRDTVIPRARFDEVNAKLHAEREEAARLRAELEALTRRWTTSTISR